ncbi:MAG TPA: N-acetylmuramoyl-L-alanine amidase [Acidimicrobiales bacterium]|nr:N-acetylmuramoyl-L-alanine amidase [Acidimicrobiales bacterium]
MDSRGTAVLRVVVAVLVLASVGTAVAVGRAEVSPLATPPKDAGNPPTELPVTTLPPEPIPSTTAPAAPAGPPKAMVSPSGVVLPVIGPEGAAWRVRTPCGNQTVIGNGRPVTQAMVVIDPGHGGEEPGAVSEEHALNEKEVNLGVSRELAKTLELQGISSVLTRYSDHRVPLTARAEVAKAMQPRAFVSIHHNSEPDGPFSGPGAETYYQHRDPESKRLAGLILEELRQTFAILPVTWVGDSDAGAKMRVNSNGEDYYGILRHTNGIPGVLSEAAFVSNPDEAKLLRTVEFQRLEADAMARAIVRFFNTRDPGSGFVDAYPRQSPAGSGGGNKGCVDPPL